MFGKLSKTLQSSNVEFEVVEAVSSHEQPKQVQVQVIEEPTREPVKKPEFEGVALEEYCQVANSIGFSNGSLLEWRLKNFLTNEGIQVYDYKKVSNYMDAQIQELNRAINEQNNMFHWEWTALRKKDAKVYLQNNGHLYSSEYSGRTYEKPVPYPVLLTVQKIEKEFGEQVYFFVTDIRKVPLGDPFLAIVISGIEVMVIERWDEPSFRG